MPDAPEAPAASADAHLTEHRTGSQTLLSGGYLEVRRDTVRLPDGSTATREFVQHSGAVAIIPMLDDGRRVLVRQHRHPVGRVLLEWPAGKLDEGEDPLHCAMRELREETGYRAGQWALAGHIHNAAAYSTEIIHLYFARALVAGEKSPDVGEFVETVCLTEAQLLALDLRGELPDVKTLIGLHWLQQLHGGQRSCQWIDVPSGTRPDSPPASG